MAQRKIVTEEAPILRKKCRYVTTFDNRLWELLDDMAETMKKADGAGLAAPQVGILKRIVVVDAGNGLKELINPEIVEVAGQQVGREGCLSVPGVVGIVSRPNVVKVRAQNRNGEFFEVEGTELEARAFCHECDHLDGILFTDIMERLASEDDE